MHGDIINYKELDTIPLKSILFLQERKPGSDSPLPTRL